MVDPRSVPEIKEALALLEAYETSGARYEDAQRFQSALHILNDYAEDNPGSPHLAFIKNTKLASTRRMLERLGRVNKADVKASIEHIVILVATVGDECKALFVEHPELKVEYERLIDTWKYELALALTLDEEKRQKRKG